MDNLCLSCNAFLEGPRTAAPGSIIRYLHHQNIFTFKLAAENGCLLCKTVWESLTKDERAQVYPYHTWSLDRISYDRHATWLPMVFVSVQTKGLGFWLPIAVMKEDDLLPEAERPILSDLSRIRKIICFESVEDSRSRPYAGCKLSNSTGGKTSLDISLRWIRNCIQNHSLCKFEGTLKRQLPSRLISTGTSESTSARLCHSRDLPLQTQYITLSHRWGIQNMAALTSKNVKKLVEEIEVSNLPKTFQDAIAFTRASDIGYLWIDSLCIIQDSEEDWNFESTLMASVYSNAWCNIAADGAIDGRTGCFFSRDIESVQPAIIKIPTQALRNRISSTLSRFVRRGDSLYSFKDPAFAGGTYRLGEDEFWTNSIEVSALARRAWVLQERLLAKRVIHFTETQIFFECCQFQACEVYQDGLPKWAVEGGRRTPNVKAMFANHQLQAGNVAGGLLSAFSAWNMIVHTYSQCGLTYDRDKLIALSGLAQNLKLSFNCEYLAGLWSEDLEKQLFWHSSGNAYRPDTYVSPSWSWASIKGRVRFGSTYPTKSHFGHGRSVDVWEHMCKIQEKNIETVDGSEMGLVVSGYLRLVGKFIPVDFSTLSYAVGSCQIKMPPDNFHGGSPFHVRYLTVSFYQDITNERLEGIYYFVPMLYATDMRFSFSIVYGLVLKRIGETKGEFQRVGMFVGDVNLADSAYFFTKASENERRALAQDLYEEYHRETDTYTFKII